MLVYQIFYIFKSHIIFWCHKWQKIILPGKFSIIDVVFSSIDMTSCSIDEVFGSIQTDNVVLNPVFQ